MKVFGISRGETGQFGIGDMVVGTEEKVVQHRDEIELDGEPVYYVFAIENGEVKVLYR